MHTFNEYWKKLFKWLSQAMVNSGSGHHVGQSPVKKNPEKQYTYDKKTYSNKKYEWN